jgi:hypothetical protein
MRIDRGVGKEIDSRPYMVYSRTKTHHVSYEDGLVYVATKRKEDYGTSLRTRKAQQVDEFINRRVVDDHQRYVQCPFSALYGSHDTLREAGNHEKPWRGCGVNETQQGE